MHPRTLAALVSGVGTRWQSIASVSPSSYAITHQTHPWSFSDGAKSNGNTVLTQRGLATAVGVAAKLVRPLAFRRFQSQLIQA